MRSHLTRARVGVVAGVAAVLVIAVIVVVVGRHDSEPEVSAGPTSSSTTTTALPPADEDVPGFRFLPEDPWAAGPRAPLTGLPVDDPSLLDRPLLAVKVDNLDVPGESARPQSGLAHSDVVVEEVVEGGITRFVLLLHSTDPPDVGPIRSARTTDVHLLPAFGTPLFAYSGGNPGVLAAVHAAPSIIDRGGEGAPAYVRVPERDAPHDLFLRTTEIWSRPGDARPPRPLATFRPPGEPSTIGDPVRGVAIEHPGMGASPIRWEWLAPAHRWVRYQRDTLHVDQSGYAVGPRNVVVAFVDEIPSPADPRSPEAVTVGDGEAWILTDGRLVVGRWQRPTEDAPMTFLDGAGEPVRLTAGRTWIELVPTGRASVFE
jgi:hypothetical protein